MTTTLDRSQTALIRSMKAARGLALAYTQGVTTVSVTGWPGNTGISLLSRIQAEPSSGSQTSNADFMVVASELGLTPKIGDTIATTINGSSLDYVVVPVDPGNPAWKWSDEQTRQVYRIHATATPWVTVNIYRTAPSPGTGGLRDANSSVVTSGAKAKFVPNSFNWEHAEKVVTRKKYTAYFQDNTISLLAGDQIQASGVRYEVMVQSAIGRTSQMPQAECERIT